MWVIHVKDALTDQYYRRRDWASVIRCLSTLPAGVTGDVTITWDPTL